MDSLPRALVGRKHPAEKENTGALKLLDNRLHNADAARVTKTGRALYRRLTALEYENALRDLLHLPGLRIKHLLPEDERRHGYNKIGQALDLSNVHLNQFMDAADLKKQTDRLLADPRSDRFIADFTDQWLDLRKIDATQPDTKLYPEAREHLKHSMIAETRAFLRELITKDRRVTHLVKSDFAMLNQSLADHYGVPGVTGCDLRRVSLPADSPRGAFLAQTKISHYGLRSFIDAIVQSELFLTK